MDARVGLALAELLIVPVLFLFLLDFIFTLVGSKPVGRYAWQWLRLHPWVNLAFALVLAAMIGHFFAKQPGAY
jgi:hypothetical protein